VTTAESVEWIVAQNEVEAFFLEFNLIKKHKPRFNIRLKDDKSYPYLAVTLDEDWPRAMVLRGAKRKGFDFAGADCLVVGELEAVAEEFFAAGKPCFGCDQEFFPEGHVKTNFICNLGYGDPASLQPRLPRLSFNEACSLL